MNITKISSITSFGKQKEITKSTNKYNDLPTTEIRNLIFMHKTELARILRNMNEKDKDDYIKLRKPNEWIKGFVFDIADLRRELKKRGENPFEDEKHDYYKEKTTVDTKNEQW